MPITSKKSLTAKKKTTKSRSKTPRIKAKELDIDIDDLIALHEKIEEAKVVGDELKCSDGRRLLLAQARERIFKQERGSFVVELENDRVLMVKPSTRRYPLDARQQELIEDIIERSGNDAGDYYHESHEIKVDADTLFERLGEDRYMEYQSDLAELMAKYEAGDCWSMTEVVIAKPDFHESRYNLPPSVNLEIEEVKPTTIAIEAKREI